MSDKIKVVGIKINCPSGELTLDEAKTLYNALHELFGKKVEYIPSTPIIIEKEVHPWRSYPPVTLDTPPIKPYWLGPDITCKFGNSSFTANLIGESC